MQKQMENVSGDTIILRKNKKTLMIKNTITEIKNFFDELMKRMNAIEERISEPENMITETSQTENRKEERPRKAGQNI